LKTLEATASDRDINVLVSVGSDFTTPIKKVKLENQCFWWVTHEKPVALYN